MKHAAGVRLLDFTPVMIVSGARIIGARYVAIGLGNTTLCIMAGMAAALFLSLRFFMFRGPGGRIDRLGDSWQNRYQTGYYLGFLAEGRQADIYRRHCSGAGSTFSLYLRGSEGEAFAFLDSLQIAHLTVRLYGTETLASHPAVMTHLSVPDQRKQALGITDNTVSMETGTAR
jgi:hypothetical protein